MRKKILVKNSQLGLLDLKKNIQRNHFSYFKFIFQLRSVTENESAQIKKLWQI